MESTSALRFARISFVASFHAARGLAIGDLRRTDRGRRRVHFAEIREERLQLEVFPLRDAIELVMVAARARERLREKDLADRIGDVGRDLILPLHEVARVVVVGIPAEEAGRHHHVLVARRDLVSGDLFLDELVVRLVGGERVDDVVAVAPHVGAGLIVLEPGAVGVAREIQPAARLALGVPRRCEQAIDQPRVRVGRWVGDEVADIGRGRDEAPRVQRRPADQRRAVGVGRRRQPLALDPRQHERVDGRAAPCPMRDGRRRRTRHRLIRPVAGSGSRRGGRPRSRRHCGGRRGGRLRRDRHRHRGEIADQREHSGLSHGMAPRAPECRTGGAASARHEVGNRSRTCVNSDSGSLARQRTGGPCAWVRRSREGDCVCGRSWHHQSSFAQRERGWTNRR